MRIPIATEPELLWHYTDAQGLLGIVKSGTLRFGDTLFLNDRTEGVYGASVMNDILSGGSGIQDPERILTVLRAAASDEISATRLYACSLSAIPDSISQWQRYGADGQGYCVGFRTKALDKVLPQRAERRRMIYEGKEQRKAIVEFLKRARTYIYRNPRPPRTKRIVIPYPQALAPFIDEFAMLVLSMKNPYFLDEQEWRYFLNIREVREAALGIKPSFAVSAGRLKPYLEFPDESPREPKLNRALAHVICGPRLEMSAAKAAVERLLVVHRYTECNVRCSVLADVWR